MTKKEAVAMFNSGWWKTKTPVEIAAFQLNEERLCLPFHEFHIAVEKALGRSVYKHEFADRDALVAELEGKAPAPDFGEVLKKLEDRIGSDKVILVSVPEDGKGA